MNLLGSSKSECLFVATCQIYRRQRPEHITRTSAWALVCLVVYTMPPCVHCSSPKQTRALCSAKTIILIDIDISGIAYTKSTSAAVSKRGRRLALLLLSGGCSKPFSSTACLDPFRACKIHDLALTAKPCTYCTLYRSLLLG